MAAHPRWRRRGARCGSTPGRDRPLRRVGSRRRVCSLAPRAHGRVAPVRHSPAPCCSSRCGRAGRHRRDSSPAVAQWRRCTRVPDPHSADANYQQSHSLKDRASRTSRRPPRSATAAPLHRRGQGLVPIRPPRSGQSRQGSVVPAHRCAPAGQLRHRCDLRDCAPPPARSAQSLRALQQTLPRRRLACALPASRRRSFGARRPSARGSRTCALQNDSLGQRAARADRRGSADRHRHQHLWRSL